MAEQTNFYAVQRGAPWSFTPVSDGVINWYLYNFGSNLGVAFVERPSNLWVEMPWNCIFRVKNIVFSSASGERSPPDPPLWAPYIFTSGFFFFPCAHPWLKCYRLLRPLLSLDTSSIWLYFASFYRLIPYPFITENDRISWHFVPPYNPLSIFFLSMLHASFVNTWWWKL